MKKSTNKYNNIIFTIILIIFFEPQIFKEEYSFNGVQIIDNVYKILKIISFIFVLFSYFKKNTKLSKLILYITILQFVGLISTIIHSGNIVRFIGPAITTITMAMIAEILIKRKNIIDILININIYFRIGFIINLITIILIDFTDFKNICSISFFGIDNRYIFELLPWITFEGIVSIHKYNKLSKKWLIVVIASESILTYKFSVSAMLSIFIFIILYFINDKFKISRYSIKCYILYLMSNILIVIFQVQNKFKNIIIALKKDLTFSGRTYLWNAIIKNMYEYPMLGIGMQSIEMDKSFFYNSTAPYYIEACKVVHAHNSIMTLLYRGGIISICIYLLIIKDCVVKLKKNFNNIFSKLLFATLLIIFITSIFDTMDFSGLYFIIALIINIDKLETKSIKNSKNYN